MNQESSVNPPIRPDAGPPPRGVIDVYRDWSLGTGARVVRFVPEYGGNQGFAGGIGQHFPGRAGSRGVGQGQAGSGAFWNRGS